MKRTRILTLLVSLVMLALLPVVLGGCGETALEKAVQAIAENEALTGTCVAGYDSEQDILSIAAVDECDLDALFETLNTNIQDQEIGGIYFTDEASINAYHHYLDDNLRDAYSEKIGAISCSSIGTLALGGQIARESNGAWTAAAAKAAKVQGHELKAELTESLMHRPARRAGRKKRDILCGHFDSGQAPVETHALRPETKPDQDLLSLPDPFELFFTDLLTVGKSRCEAGTGGLVPGSESECFREFADLLLSQPGFPQRASDGKLTDGPKTRTIVAKVIQIRSLGHIRKAICRGEPQDFRKNLPFAVVASVRSISSASLDLKRLRFAEHLPDPVRLTEGPCLPKLSLRDQRIDGGNGQHPIAKCPYGCRQQKRRVNTAGESHGDGAQRAKDFLQPRKLLLKISG